MQALFIDELIENDVFKFNLHSRNKYIYTGFIDTKRGRKHIYFNPFIGKTYVTYKGYVIVYLVSSY